MNTPTHCLVALALLSKKADPKRNWVVFVGSLIPDAFIFVAWIWLTVIERQPQSRIWNEIYFDAPMQLAASLFNSFPIYLGLLGVGIISRGKYVGRALIVFSSAALLHIALDFPVHNHDAYAHFWPITDWRFISPLSYYEGDHHARWVSLVEWSIVGACSFLLWRRFRTHWVRVCVSIIFALVTLMSFVQFYAHFGSQVAA